jgi:hypothetical protein
MNTQRRNEIWTYLGLRQARAGAFVHAWRDPAGDIWSFRKRLANVPVGGHVRVTLTDDGKIVAGGPDRPMPLLDSHDNDEDIAAWVAEDERVNNIRRIRAIERQAAKNRPLDHILADLRWLTARLNGPQRRAFAAAIMQEVFTKT